MLLGTTSRFSGEKLYLKKFWLIIISLALVSIHVYAQHGWTNKGLIPTPRAAMTASVIDNKIFVIGGNNGSPNFSDLDVNEVYDPAPNTWETKAPLPAPRGWPSSAVVNGIIYVIGGGYPSATNSMYAYDPVANSWSTKAILLSPRRAAQAGVVNGIIYNIGGNQSERNCEAYNPITNIWTAKTSMPGAGGDIAVTVYNGLIYTFGGSNSSWQPYSNVYAYDPQTDTWVQKQNMPTARFGLLTYLVGNKIYAIGGSQSSGTSVGKVEVYDPYLDSWETLADMPFTDNWFAGAVVNNKIYVIGGTPDGATGVLNVWEYDPFWNIPVELTSFTASANGKEVTLNWSTATELNNQGFEVQRKFGSNDFVTVGSVIGHGTTTTPNNYTFVDKLFDAGKYIYRLKQIDYGGKYEYSQEVEVNWSPFTTYKLEQNYPNPFNPTTTIGFGIHASPNSSKGGAFVTLKVYDILGNEVKTLVNKEMETGYHSADFNASDLPSGIFFYRLQAGNYVETKKMILLR